MFSPKEHTSRGVNSAGQYYPRGPGTPNRIINSTPNRGSRLEPLRGDSEAPEVRPSLAIDDEIIDETERRVSRSETPPSVPVKHVVVASAPDCSPTSSRSTTPSSGSASSDRYTPVQVATPVTSAAVDVRSSPSRIRPSSTEQEKQPAPTSTSACADSCAVGRSESRIRPSGLPATPPRVTLGRKELIGAGSFGSVYKALEVETNRTIAVKEIRLQHSDATPQAQKELAALEREIKVMQKLSHPNIVKYLGYTRGEGTFNIHMEFVPCGTVATLLRTFGPLSAIQAALFTKQILAGLEYLHARNVVHRDLKGDNLFVDTDGTLKVGDFGTAKELQTMRQSNSVAGTPYFMAPEVVRNGGHGLEADVWSVGCCVIQMLTGEPPYRKYDNQITVMFQVSKGDIDSQIPTDITGDAKDFIQTCCRLRPKDRPPVSALLRHPWLLSAPPLQPAKVTEDERSSSDVQPVHQPKDTELLPETNGVADHRPHIQSSTEQVSRSHRTPQRRDAPAPTASTSGSATRGRAALKANRRQPITRPSAPSSGSRLGTPPAA